MRVSELLIGTGIIHIREPIRDSLKDLIKRPDKRESIIIIIFGISLWCWSLVIIIFGIAFKVESIVIIIFDVAFKVESLVIIIFGIALW